MPDDMGHFDGYERHACEQRSGRSATRCLPDSGTQYTDTSKRHARFATDFPLTGSGLLAFAYCLLELLVVELDNIVCPGDLLEVPHDSRADKKQGCEREKSVLVVLQTSLYVASKVRGL